MAANEGRQRLQDDTALALDLLQFAEIRKDPIDERFVGQRPEPFGGLEFWGIGREKDEMQPVWDDHLPTGMPACTIQDQDHLFVWPRTYGVRKGRQDQREEIDPHRG